MLFYANCCMYRTMLLVFYDCHPVIVLNCRRFEHLRFHLAVVFSLFQSLIVRIAVSIGSCVLLLILMVQQVVWTTLGVLQYVSRYVFDSFWHRIHVRRLWNRQIRYKQGVWYVAEGVSVLMLTTMVAVLVCNLSMPWAQ